MVFGFGRGAQVLEASVEAALRGKAVAEWPLPAAQAEVVRRLVERLRAREAEAEAAEGRRRESEAALGYQCVRFDLITSGTVDGLWDMSVVAGDPVNEGNEIWWSPQFRRILGFQTEAEFPNQLESLYSRIHPEDKEAMLAKLLAHIEDRTGRTPFDTCYRVKVKGGEYRWFRALGATHRDAAGMPLRVAGSLSDITEQRERERELDITLTRFELGSAMLNDGLWDMSVIAGDPINPKNEFWWSQQLRHLLGFESEADFPNVFESWSSRLHPQEKDTVLGAFAAHLNDRSGRTPFDMKYRLKLKSGHYRWFHARGMTKRAADGTPLRAVGALTDIEAARQMEDVAQTLNVSARDIVAGSGDLSGRTEQQAAALEETASSMEELTSAVRQNAENVGKANQLIQETSRSARDGGAVVEDVVATMGSIHDSSRRIAEIISVIDGIAFQTNILALNAAVEAARAGEQGRGFAVVASEVRSLAQRSATAAKEIKGLIDDSVSKVAVGSSLVAKAGQSMQGIVASVQLVTDLMAEIAAASQEQSTGIDQVNTTVMQLDVTTQQNAGLAEEMAASAHALEEKAGELLRSVLANRRDAAPVVAMAA